LSHTPTPTPLPVLLKNELEFSREQEKDLLGWLLESQWGRQVFQCVWSLVLCGDVGRRQEEPHSGENGQWIRDGEAGGLFMNMVYPASFVCVLFIVGTGAWTKGFTLAWQTFWCLSHTSSPLDALDMCPLAEALCSHIFFFLWCWGWNPGAHTCEACVSPKSCTHRAMTLLFMGNGVFWPHADPLCPCF
jgi:hypothetical protein